MAKQFFVHIVIVFPAIVLLIYGSYVFPGTAAAVSLSVGTVILAIYVVFYIFKFGRRFCKPLVEVQSSNTSPETSLPPPYSTEAPPSYSGFVYKGIFIQS